MSESPEAHRIRETHEQRASKRSQADAERQRYAARQRVQQAAKGSAWEVYLTEQEQAGLPDGTLKVVLDELPTRWWSRWWYGTERRAPVERILYQAGHHWQPTRYVRVAGTDSDRWALAFQDDGTVIEQTGHAEPAIHAIAAAVAEATT